ncbi:MAG: 1-acyl-sn-glycerol-3-phosphate acyltransferase [Kiritimatiellae bacterium]|nr:1-acyl-sn-glycerol-3-phosphate acyltransferase [Kiritimatiellia bacterium]
MRAFVRGTTSVLLFGVFGLGALLITPLMLVLRRPERCQPIVRTTWRFILSVFIWTRLIRIDRGNLGEIRGSVIAASHPSLIDVVMLTALIPRTMYVAKEALRGNPFLTAIVRATALPDDPTLPEKAAPFLAKGWNVLIFPEGTRSPAAGGLQPLRRGAAQLALRAGAPVACIRLTTSRRILGKRQPPWDLGDHVVTYSLAHTTIPVEKADGPGIHAAAVRLTEQIRKELLHGFREG